ncbi:MAG: hypothetical protein ACRD10_03455 [Terriglobia bacterium]
MEVSLKKLVGNQVVQGELLSRLEQVVARNTEAIAQNTEAIGQVAQATSRVAEVTARLAESAAATNGRMDVMQAAMERLFEHIDRFIRGLEGNGHRPALGPGQ